MSVKKYPYYDEKIPVVNLFLDSENPRLPNYIQGKSQKEIVDYMLLEESTLELMQAIGKNGFFKGEQLLVIESGKKYKVIEGNRRLTSVILLNNPNYTEIQSGLVSKIIEESKFTNISDLPCMVFEKEDDIHDYLGYRHVTGIQPWNLRQKAKYLKYLKDKNFPHLSVEEASNELRKMIGSKGDYVKRILVGNDIYLKLKDNAFFKIKGLEDETFYFSYIADSLRHSKIEEYIGADLSANDPLKSLNLKHLENWRSIYHEYHNCDCKTFEIVSCFIHILGRNCSIS
jgi:hypothetical protein